MRIEWTEPALSDLADLRDYIARDSEENAVRFVGRLIHSVEKLSAFPQMGRRVPEAQDETIRELLFQNYRVLYRIDPTAIRILTILHGKQDLAGRSPKPWERR
ncbi:MAG TPA: type II toxin-antitoxin system RelE/ParE family toxin [Thermoanaerobaculia bacterium]|nr:type II toxin-antitoxin system RelE/ParE family toxin [Thermoanaerobaculia bacterium]